MFEPDDALDHPTDFKKVHMTIARQVVCLYEGLPEVLVKENNVWKKIKVK